jgi:uncharacterized protein DUF2092
MEDLMSLLAAYRFTGSRIRWMAFAILIALTTILSASAPARAEDDAAQILKAMSDYVSSQQSISLTFNSDIEVITPEIQKIQFASSGKLLLRVPISSGPTELAAIPMSKSSSTARRSPFWARTSMPTRNLRLPATWTN